MISLLFSLLYLSSFTAGDTVEARFKCPDGYQRIALPSTGFASYLRAFPLKPNGAKVLLYNGQEKNYQGGAAGVLDIDIGKRDLQQCADAVMRLRAEHLYKKKDYENIHFNLTNGFRVGFKKWAEGYRVKVSRNKTWWEHTKAPSYSYATFRDYLTFVFTYAGTLSLSKELKPASIESIMPGDVFIQGGSPGHAVIVMDVAVHKESGNRIFLLAQSYMPAQSIHVLKNLHYPKLSPWYSLATSDQLITPEWVFEATDLKRFL